MHLANKIVCNLFLGLDFKNEFPNLPSGHKEKLTSEWGRYLDCVRSVENGYFKRKRTYDSQDSLESLRSNSLEDVDNSLQSKRFRNGDSQLFDQYGEVLKQLLGSEQQSRDYDRDNIMSELGRNSITDSLLTKDDISSLVKR